MRRARQHGGRRLHADLGGTRKLEVFDVTNASTIVGTTLGVGSTCQRLENRAPPTFRPGMTFVHPRERPKMARA